MSLISSDYLSISWTGGVARLIYIDEIMKNGRFCRKPSKPEGLKQTARVRKTEIDA